MTITAQSIKDAYLKVYVATDLIRVLEHAIEDAKTDLLRKQHHVQEIGEIYETNMRTMKEHRACHKVQS